MYQQLIQQSTNNNPMTAAFIFGGLAVAGVFAFVYFQKKNSQKQNSNSNSNNDNGQTGDATPSFGNGDDNSSSGTGGTTPVEFSK